MWVPQDMLHAVKVGLTEKAGIYDTEQAVRGLDALDEISIHPIIQKAFRAPGYGVFPEERFPSDRLKKNRSEGKRCDIVLTPNNKPLASPDRENTLFDPPNTVNLEDAYWLEVKTTSQFTTNGEPNRRYSAELMAPVRNDVHKLAKDPKVSHAGILLIVYVAETAIFEHDLTIWQQSCIERGYPIGTPLRTKFTISDRIGHQYAAISLIPVYHL